MTREKSDKAEELFLLAAAMAGPQRIQFVHDSCSGDAELEREVQSLLSYDQGEALASIVSDAAESLLGGATIGTRVGAYRITSELGRGGMGAVYEAVRDDDSFRKRVAVKLVKRGMDTDAVLDRFRHERQILANLDHPYIAKLLDGGSTQDGRPYFVMERIEGELIHHYCERQNRTERQRLELFGMVCDAVAYAHRNLVIHRDLKPSNILVTAEGSPRLLDFGIAKVLAESPEGLTGALTGVGANPHTPGYASPEQVRGEHVTTSTDVFSLGAVLSQMRPAGRSRDLENIIRMAMHEEPERRYRSVDELRGDIERYLAGMPVRARADSWRYRAAKFLTRHKGGVAAAAILAVSMVAGTVGTAWQARRAGIQQRVAEGERQRAQEQTREAEREHQRAEQEAKRAMNEAARANQQRDQADRRLLDMTGLVDETLVDLDRTLERTPGALAARRDLVKSTLHFLDKLRAEVGSDVHVLQTLVTAYIRVGDIQGYPHRSNLGDVEGALRSYEAALGLTRGLDRRIHGDRRLELQWIGLEQRLGELRVSRQQTEAAMVFLRSGMARAERLLARFPGDETALLQVAIMHHALGDSISRSDGLAGQRHAEAELAIYRKLVRRDPENGDLLNSLSSGYSVLGASYLNQGQVGKASEQYRAGVAIREKLLAAQPGDAIVRRNMMISYGRLAGALGLPTGINLGDRAGALAVMEKCLRLAEGQVAADPKDRTGQTDLVNALLRTASAMPENSPDAVPMLDRALRISDAMPGAMPPSVVAQIYDFRGQRMVESGQYAAAVGSFSKAFELAEALPMTGRALGAKIRRLSALRGLALAQAHLRNRVEALACSRRYVESAEIYFRNSAGSEDPEVAAWVAESLETQGDVWALLGDRSAAWAAHDAARREWLSRRGAWQAPVRLAALEKKLTPAVQ